MCEPSIEKFQSAIKKSFESTVQLQTEKIIHTFKQLMKSLNPAGYHNDKSIQVLS